ncbi:chromate reductase [Sinorhizobium fredii]|uniref:Oxidoreductase protein n=1 Tax=Sinorhizobium fredii (strain USDA 257) TaxID=1185652 RepID=I3XDC9_SINF2|nr:oxidoreductase protein [Sinorhizobium fredii USDA 257]
MLEALRLSAPTGVAIEICDVIGDLPIFNPDREGEATPATVRSFAAKIAAADGLIIACPEYAHGIPGGLKNALDWLVSRDEVPFKPVMLAHASHRGDHVLEQLTEVLNTMSLHLVTEAFLRVPLLGKGEVDREEILGAACANGLLSRCLRTFADSIVAGAAA